jgi:hypothetical protein
MPRRKFTVEQQHCCIFAQLPAEVLRRIALKCSTKVALSICPCFRRTIDLRLQLILKDQRIINSSMKKIFKLAPSINEIEEISSRNVCQLRNVGSLERICIISIRSEDISLQNFGGLRHLEIVGHTFKSKLITCPPNPEKLLTLLFDRCVGISDAYIRKATNLQELKCATTTAEKFSFVNKNLKKLNLISHYREQRFDLTNLQKIKQLSLFETFFVQTEMQFCQFKQLQKLFLPHDFNIPLTGLLSALENLVFLHTGLDFDQALTCEDFRSQRKLEVLIFAYKFNKPLAKSLLHLTTLKRLEFQRNFCSSLQNELPNNLEILGVLETRWLETRQDETTELPRSIHTLTSTTGLKLAWPSVVPWFYRG